MNTFEVTSEVELDFTKLAKLDASTQKALEMTADALLTEIKNAQVMPFDTGHLQNESTFVNHSYSSIGVESIVSATPYARRLYFHPEYNFSHKENQNAGGEWFRYWTNGGTRQNFCEEAFAKFYKGLTGV